MSNSSEEKINLGNGLVAAWSPMPSDSEKKKVSVFTRLTDPVPIAMDKLINSANVSIDFGAESKKLGAAIAKKFEDEFFIAETNKSFSAFFLKAMKNVPASISCVSTPKPNPITPLSLAGRQLEKSASKTSLTADQNDTIDLFAATCTFAANAIQPTKEDILKAIATMRNASIPSLNGRGKAEIEDATEKMYRTKNPDPDAFLEELKDIGYVDSGQEDEKSKQYFALKKYGCRIPLGGLTALRGRKANFGLLDDLYELLLSSGLFIADTIPHLASIVGREYRLDFDKVLFATNKEEVNSIRPCATNYASFRNVLMSLAKWCCSGQEKTIADVDFFLFSKAKSYLDMDREKDQETLSLLRRHKRELDDALEEQTDAFNALKLQLESAKKELDLLRLDDRQKNTAGRLTSQKVKRKVTRLPAQ